MRLKLGAVFDNFSCYHGVFYGE